MWDEPDGHEQSMMAGCSGARCWPDSPMTVRWPDWPQFLHDGHAGAVGSRRSTGTGSRIQRWPARSLTTWSMVSGRRGVWNVRFSWWEYGTVSDDTYLMLVDGAFNDRSGSVMRRHRATH
jgi:hypothetical protein